VLHGGKETSSSPHATVQRAKIFPGATSQKITGPSLEAFDGSRSKQHGRAGHRVSERKGEGKELTRSGYPYPAFFEG
jgi:hypothetical protein